MSNDNWQNDWCVIFPKQILGLSCLNYEKIHGSVFLCKHLHHRLKSWLQCNTDSFLCLLPHRLIYTADPIMSAGRDSFYTALESIIDSVGCVLFDSKTFPPQEEERGSDKRVWEGRRPLRRGNIHWAGQSLLDLEVLEVEAQLWLEQTWERRREKVVMSRFTERDGETLGIER